MANRETTQVPMLGPPDGLEVEMIELDGQQYAVLKIPKRGAPPAPRLTRAEQEVLQDLLRGLKTQQIAARRGTSPRTVSNQIASIFRAYGVASRGELFARCRQVQAEPLPDA
jgi:DNA-binding NarL/FixJ family response regulator